MDKKHYFLSGIGGSGMLPLALILKGIGHDVSGSDRGRDQGRTPLKFSRLEAQGIPLYPQDGSGLKCAAPKLASSPCMLDEFSHRPDALIVSAAVEDTVPDVRAAKEAGIPILKRAQLLAEIFNGFKHRVAIGGTSGKTTTTGMIGFILHEAGRDPVMMNGGIVKNFGATALTGKSDVFITESDESDGSIAFYQPDVAVLTNVSVDHKGIEELRALFGDFVTRARVSIINADNAEAAALAGSNTISYGLKSGQYTATSIHYLPEGVDAEITDGMDSHPLSLSVPGAHNLSNALAAIAAAGAMGIPLSESCAILERFQGIKRRMELVGQSHSISVIDDFAHNPDKIAATLSALRRFEGRLLIIFQMHGYGPLKLLWQDLAASFAQHLAPDDHIFLCDPLYLGGTADKSIGMDKVAAAIGPRAEHHPTREACGEAALAISRPGDRIIVMGARDDTLSDFAATLLQSLQKR